MPIAHVQSTGAQQSAGSNTLAKPFGSNVGTGNLLLCLVISNASTAATFTVNGSVNGSYTSAVRVVSGNFVAELFYKSNSSAGIETVTVSSSNGLGSLSMAISEYSGVATTGPLDGTNSGSGTDASPVTGSVSVAGGGELLYGGMGTLLGVSDTITPGSGFTERFEGNASVTLNGVEAEDKIVSAAQTVTWSLSGANSWVAVAASFKAASAVGPWYDRRVIPATAGDPPESAHVVLTDPLSQGSFKFQSGPGLGIPKRGYPPFLTATAPPETEVLLLERYNQGYASVQRGPTLPVAPPAGVVIGMKAIPSVDEILALQYPSPFLYSAPPFKSGATPPMLRPMMAVVTEDTFTTNPPFSAIYLSLIHI